VGWLGSEVRIDARPEPIEETAILLQPQLSDLDSGTVVYEMLIPKRPCRAAASI